MLTWFLAIAAGLTILVFVIIYANMVVSHKRLMNRCSMLVRAYVASIDSDKRLITLQFEVDDKAHIVTEPLLDNLQWSEGQYIDLYCNPNKYVELYYNEMFQALKVRLTNCFVICGSIVAIEVLLFICTMILM